MNGSMLLSHLVGYDRSSALEAARLVFEGHGTQQVSVQILLGGNDGLGLERRNVFLQFHPVPDKKDTLKVVILQDIGSNVDPVAFDLDLSRDLPSDAGNKSGQPSDNGDPANKQKAVSPQGAPSQPQEGVSPSPLYLPYAACSSPSP